MFFRCVTAWAGLPEADRAYESGNHAYAFNEYMILAEHGDVSARVNVGWMYYYGEGVPQDKVQALVWYRKAAELGDITSMFNLAYGYEHGDGVGQDLDESRRWYRKAAEQKNALERLDFERLTKKMLPPNAIHDQAARVWFGQKKARAVATAEDAKNAAAAVEIAEAACLKSALRNEKQTGGTAASRSHETGKHASPSPAEVPAASVPGPAGTADARMAQAGKDGLPLSPSAKTGVERFQSPRLEEVRRAAESGDVNAQVALGWVYSSGNGIPVDKARAARWYRRAAEKGDLDAQRALGWMYYEGQGVERDLKESALWYHKAADQGDIKAGQMLKKINRLMRGN
jgi:TPR repeat protein